MTPRPIDGVALRKARGAFFTPLPIAEHLAPEAAAGVAAAVGFAEVAGTAVGSLLGGGLFSLGESVRVQAGWSIAMASAMLAAVAAGALHRSGWR